MPKFYLHPPHGMAQNIVEVPAIQQPLATETIARLEPPARHENALFDQAGVYLRQGDHANAIAAFSAVIDDTSLPIELRQKARKSRGAAYLGRGGETDIDKAIIDHMAAGLDGISLSVRAESAQLKAETTVLGTVKKGQVLTVSSANGNWLWVKSINGDETLQGWIDKSALIKKTTTAAVKNTAARQTTTQVLSQTPSHVNSHQFQPQMSHQLPAGGDSFTRDYIRRNGRPPSIWETPGWESPAEIQRLRAQGLVR
jgi:hypothetical protein